MLGGNGNCRMMCRYTVLLHCSVCLAACMQLIGKSSYWCGIVPADFYMICLGSRDLIFALFASPSKTNSLTSLPVPGPFCIPIKH